MTRKKTSPFMALLVGVCLAGFGWLIIKNFANLFANFSAQQQIGIGVLGFVLLTWIVKEFKIRADNPLRK